jgi:hypothetical protein
MKTAKMLLFIIFIFLTSCVREPLFTEEAERYWDSCANEVGKQIVIDHDTLTILTYDLWYNNFKLSNGVEISPRAVKRIKTL